MRIDKWPSTPAKLILAWFMTLATFVLTGFLLWLDRHVNIEVYAGWLAFLASYDGITAYQFKAKRETAWEPPSPPTKSESTKPPESGQPAAPNTTSIATPYGVDPTIEPPPEGRDG